MEQVDPIEREQSPQVPQEPRYDPERASRRKVRVIKVPYSHDPMKEKTVFEFGGYVYICYAKKTRGRSMIRCLGLSQVEPDPKIMDPEPAAKGLADAIDEQVMKEAIDDDVVQGIITEVAGHGESLRPDETPNP